MKGKSVPWCCTTSSEGCLFKWVTGEFSDTLLGLVKKLTKQELLMLSASWFCDGLGFGLYSHSQPASLDLKRCN